VSDEVWPLCYGVVMPALKTNVTETFTVLSFIMLVMAQLLYGVIKND
jgi:hypothetical protein